MKKHTGDFMKMRYRGILSFLVVIGFVFYFQIMPGIAQSEKIFDFNSRITVHVDGSMTVTETIRVLCAGQQIKRGIYRTFPTRYKDRFGNTIRVLFEVEEVLKNGETEPYHIEKVRNGVEVYFGQSDVLLDPGVYTYTLVYRTDRQLGFFEDFDELYWNVTGVDWAFVIDRAEAVVILPEGAEVLNTAAYTGPQGARGQDFTVQTNEAGEIRFITTAPLQPEEGLTIAVSFTKGIIPEPTAREKTVLLMKDNPSTMAALTGFCVLLLYYIIVWSIVGKDPPKGTIIPRFYPPKGYSPAATRYVMRMGYSDTVFAAALISMAVKGYVTIQERKGQFSLSRTEADETSLTKGEKNIAKKLFGRSRKITFKKTSHRRIRNAIDALKKSLRTDFEKINFRRNRWTFLLGVVFTFLTLIAVVLTAPVKEGAIFMSIWLTGWTVGCYVLVRVVIKGWKSVLAGGKAKSGERASVVIMTLFSLPFLAGEGIGLWFFTSMASPLTSVVLLVLVFINMLFNHLLKAPTVYGRKVMDQIEGFKMYLEVAEEERLNILHPPDKTPELFEKYLPFALALGVENAWSEKFADVLTGVGGDQEYSPAWYSGRHWNTMGASEFATSLGSSFSSAISSSSSPPGSSSGSGGGGFTGGGGGGGGGGGW